MPPIIRLYADAMFLIIRSPTGVWYSNQAGGTACLQPRAEGYLVPGPDHEVQAPIMDELLAHFTRPPYDGVGCGPSGITPATADELDALFRGVTGWPPLRVDRARLTECDEAWIHVFGTAFTDAEPGRHEGLGAHGPFEGVVTWPNSD